MTSETYLDLTFDRATKGGKRPIRPKLLKLTDVTMPHRNRKKTKVKTKDRPLSSVRDRIYDDPAYTDDISHLANPLRRNSCSGKADSKESSVAAANSSGATSTLGGSSSLGKRSKLTKEFLQYAKQSKARGGSYDRDASSSSDEQQRSAATKYSDSLGRRGRSLERNMAEKAEKKREKRERSSKQKRNLSLDNSLQVPESMGTHLNELEPPSLERSALRSSKERKGQILPKQYSDGTHELAWSEANMRLPPDQDELFSVRSSSKESTSTVGTKMQIGRRFLKGEIGIKSFNYYLLKEGLKSSKKFVEKQRNSLTGTTKKLHSRSEENIYEEIFFKDTPASDEENQNQALLQQQQQQQPPPAQLQQQHPPPQQPAIATSLLNAGTPLSQGSEDAIYPDCELCMQQCSRENCEYCFAAAQSELQGSQRGTGVRPYVGSGRPVSLQQLQQLQQLQLIQQQMTPQQFSNPLLERAPASGAAASTSVLPRQDNNNSNSSSLPTAHILEFQSYNPNNPGVYKIETTPVAITGEYNPILQFQQSSPSTATTTTTPSEQQHHQHVHHHQQPAPPQHLPPPYTPPQKPMLPIQQQAYFMPSGVPLNAIPSHYAPAGTMTVSGMVPMPPQGRRTHRASLPGNAANAHHYVVGSFNGANATASPVQRMNTKSSSSSDSLQQHQHHQKQQQQHQQQQHQQQQQLHKFNTMARLEANVLVSDPFYGGQQMHPLMYAASRPIGGSQILVDPYELPQMYKSDSKASILSEYSLRSSDNSHRYMRYRYGGRGEISDSSLGDSLFSYTSAQKRYFGSSESCRFAFECRRCSLDGGEKCSYSDTCRYECRNCDCSSSYFSSDFDDVYGSVAGGSGMPRSSGIPRKTAAGTLPSSTQPSEFERQQEQLERKQNKYAQDFFKHVNDVKRSIYQSEMQRNGSLETQTQKLDMGRVVAAGKQEGSPKRHAAKDQTVVCATLPLTKERARVQGAAAPAHVASSDATPTPAPRATLHPKSTQSVSATTAAFGAPQPSLRRTQAHDRREYPSLDRLVATATGAIPKAATVNSLLNNSNGNGGKLPTPSTKNNATNTVAAVANNVNNNNNAGSYKQSPHQSPKAVRLTDGPTGEEKVADVPQQSRVRHAKPLDATAVELGKRQQRYLNVGDGSAGSGAKSHHRTSSSKSSSSSTRRKDTPAPPPPSPATYSDLQELKANLESVQDDTKTSKIKLKPEKNATTGENTAQHKPAATKESAKEPTASATTAPIVTTKSTKDKPNDGATSTKPATAVANEQQSAHYLPDTQAATVTATASAIAIASQQQAGTNNGVNNLAGGDKSAAAKSEAPTSTGNASFNADDDDVFYDARSEDSTGTATSSLLKQPAITTTNLERSQQKDLQILDGGGHGQKRAQLQRQYQSTPQQQQQIVNKTAVAPEREREATQTDKEKLHAIKDNDCKAKDTHEDEHAEHEKTEKSRKELRQDAAERPKEPKGTAKSASGVGVAVEGPGADGKKNAAVADETQTTMALNLSKEVMASQTTPAEIKPHQSSSTAKKMPFTTEYVKVKRRSGKVQSGRQHKSPTKATSMAATLTLSCDTCCQMEECCEAAEQQQKVYQEMRLKAKTTKEKSTKIKIKEMRREKSTAPTTSTTTTTTPTAASVAVAASTAASVIASATAVAVVTTATAACADDVLPKPSGKEEVGAQHINSSSSKEPPPAATAKATNQEQEQLTENGKNGEERSQAAATSAGAANEPAATASSTTAAANIVTPAPDCSGASVVEPAAIVASVANTSVSCNSDIAGVATLSQSVPSALPTITTTQAALNQSQNQTQEIQTKRPSLQRQEYSCLDSSEAQSDDSHLTRDSVTRESQNDELSSSTHDKIDVSTLPLPALPPKKRRSRQRASPLKHHQRQRHEPEVNAEALGANASHASNNEPPPHLSAFQQYVAKRRESLEESTRCFNEKLEARRMHYHMGGGGGSGGASGSGQAGQHMPTYLFGEHCCGVPRKSVAPVTSEEIFLNKSGWVQVNTKRGNDENCGYRRVNYAHQNGDPRNTIRVIQIDNTRRSDLARQALLQHQHTIADPSSAYCGGPIPKFASSKVEELIQRNEMRLNNGNAVCRDPALRPGYRIVDPQLASLLNERPGFLPVKNLNDADSPPPITPILSPPPAFQDSSKSKHFDRRKQQITAHQVVHPLPTIGLHTGAATGGKGMVFSRSFEYDTRRPTPTDTYVETFSRSFDGNLSERPQPLQRERSPNFSTLTGNSPNYLTKKDSGGGSSGSLRSRDSSPKYQQPQTTAYLNTSIKEAPPAYSLANASHKYSPRARHERSFERSKSHNVLGAARSRKSQFSRVGSTGPASTQAPLATGMSRFRSFDTTLTQRLNSCDSGARSDLSNDELDNEDDEGSTEFLTANYHHSMSPFKTQRQRSLTPERNESHSSSSSLRKQRSLTPESRSLTPEDRRKKDAQAGGSLMGSRQNSSSRSNTLERKQRLDDKGPANISRSSSSSSYSGREHEPHGHATQLIGANVAAGAGVGTRSQHRRSLGRNAKQTEEHRIRRSRSLQLSERSPNRGHKMVVCVGQPHMAPNQPPIYQQANIRPGINNGGHSNYPTILRSSSKPQTQLLSSVSTSNAGSAASARAMRNSEIDKSRSFEFDYCNYNAATGATPKGHIAATAQGPAGAASGQNVPLRLDFDKSRSFDDDYREPLASNNNLANAGGKRYLQATDSTSGSGSGSVRLRKSSPVASSERATHTRSPQSSGSSCNNLNLPRQSTSPQNYGTRLCDHELTYDMMRKAMDRSPIMDFRRGDSGDYDLPQTVIRNRETINSGGNSELNFLSNDKRIYEHGVGVVGATAPTLKQQRSLGHAQSPSEPSQYSLERMHSMRESNDGVSEYRTAAEYMYRQPHHREARGGNRGSQQTTAKTTTTNTKQPSQLPIPTRLANQSTTSFVATCAFWPHCGACKTRQCPQSQDANIKRQNSLQIPQRPPDSKMHAMLRSASAAAYDQSPQYPNGANVSTVSVNGNVIKVHNKALIDENVTHTPTQQRRNKSQWTFLCSAGVAPPVDARLPDIAKASCHPRPPAVGAARPRVIPLAATSLVFLGDCEMPITRDPDTTNKITDLVEQDRRGNCGQHLQQSFSRQTTASNIDDSYGDDLTKNDKDKEAVWNNTDGQRQRRASTLRSQGSKRRRKLRKATRSISLPDIFEATKGYTRATSSHDTWKNGFSNNLSHQLRAVSSPSLTDAVPESSEANKATAKSTCTSASSTENDKAALSINGTGQAVVQLPTSQSVGVLQKFKRTLTNFNKHQQLQQHAGTQNANNAAQLCPTTTELSNESTESSTAKYRFGPLIWRSSKERRKTKYNRRDKCNSGDSGIQIELENDEQFARVMASGANAASTGAVSGQLMCEEDSPKLCSVRRTNSAKAGDQFTAAMSAKAKILKKIEACHEREAPESLPTRSFSQPNGLETFGIRADLDDSDSDSVTSHDEGPNYYPVYAEVRYNFTAAGPQELGLERGTLIEILRKEVGPWWFGRIKRDDVSLVKEILDPELGWFPKEFVRVIQCPETDPFFLANVAQIHSSDTPPPLPTSAMPTHPTALPPTVNIATDTKADVAVDQNNVTTIVIESPPNPHAAAVFSGNSDSNALVPSRSFNVILDNNDILRRSAVKELLDTEVNYVKLLASICEGYLPAMSKRIDIFSPNSIRLIFSNIAAIYKFQKKFLEALRRGIEQNQVAKVFLKMHKGFLCYSTYCNAYPRALIELESYDRIKDAKTILDNCREIENLAELPLSAHLLAPVQRICRYPLHLGEITKTAVKAAEGIQCDLAQLELVDISQLDMPDTKETIDMALEAMKSITEAVNEGKRHSETIARHQASFQNFKGPPLHLHSTRFFLQIDATRQKQNLWNTSCTLFLFDNQLIYCKRDIIKRSQFIYKGRIFLDRCRVVNVRNGKMFGHTIKNSLRIYCESRDKWFDFSFRSANRKHRFLNTLALERQFGGKALYVSEMTGYEYAFEERDYSDQSDNDLPDSEGGGSGSLVAVRLRDFPYDGATTTTSTNTGTSASGDSSVPESPAKTLKYSSDTLPKKTTQSNGAASTGGAECQTGSLGRRRLGNWFRKPKSTNSTPAQSPTHKPVAMPSAEGGLGTATSTSCGELLERPRDNSSSSST